MPVKATAFSFRLRLHYKAALAGGVRHTGSIVKVFGIIITLLFAALATAHLFIDAVTVDSITIILLVLASLPWLAPYLKSLELPGGFKVEIKDALKKVEEASSDIPPQEDETSYSGVDTSLAFVALRVEIEKTIRKYQSDLGHKSHSLSIRLQMLANEKIITRPLSLALLELVKLGNAAARGQEIDSEEAELILMRSTALLSKLEDSLKNA